MQTPWHCQTSDDALATLISSPAGLTREEAGRRLAAHGPNRLQDKGRRGPLAMLLDQFKDFMIVVLVAAAVISGALGEAVDTVAIVAIVILNAVVGFVQEYRAEKAMEALQQMAAPAAVALRDGSPHNVPATDLVPGDIVLLEAGRVVPADLRLLEAATLKVEEAALTGESEAVEKDTAALPEQELAVGDRRNMAYKGTFIAHGRGKGVVTATGMATELGKIAAMLQETAEAKTPLQKRLAAFGKRLAMAVLVICGVVFAAGLLRGEEPVRMLLTAISLAVAAIPEALPAVVTIALALGARKMVRQSALVRKLPAVETLGSVTYICSDKTGTLTLNRMTVEEAQVDGRCGRVDELGLPRWQESAATGLMQRPPALFLAALAVSNDAHPDKNGELLGDPTETALAALAARYGLTRGELEKLLPRVAELPFDSERKCMTTIHRLPAGLASQSGLAGARFLALTKGAAEALTERAVTVLLASGLQPLDRPALLAAADGMAADGLRVLGVGYRLWAELPAAMTPETMETELTMLGLAGLLDPPRQEAAEAVRLCRSAGIRPVMITGDHPATARAIARRLAILADGAGVVTGRELAAMPPADLAARVEGIRVYARVAPEQKLDIVRALQERGHYVAMTGDGVNDAPALKRADIGVAMGLTGTDVSKEASAMILLDDNFATIVKAVREGRKIYDNIRKFVKYLLTTNAGEIWTLFLAPFLGLPIPLLPIHILWINLVTDSLPALALSAEPAESDIMDRPPRRPDESIFAHGLGAHAIWVGLVMAAVVLGLEAWLLNTGAAHWQTEVFTVLCLTQLGHVLAIRSEEQSLFRQGLRSNLFLLAAVAVTFGLQLATIYVPFLNQVFRTVPLSPADLGMTVLLSGVVFVAVELEKWVKRRRSRRRDARR
ncbi:MAG: cation-translocating P-type ATPase [Thermodesulfobacteriota bacterium]